MVAKAQVLGAGVALGILPVNGSSVIKMSPLGNSMASPCSDQATVFWIFIYLRVTAPREA